MKKPKVNFSGENGNIFNLMSIARKALKKAGMEQEAANLVIEIHETESYDGALAVLAKHVDAE